MTLLSLLLSTALAGPRLLPAHGLDDSAASEVFEGRRLALLVGPEGFDDPGFVTLRYTDDDARAVADALADPARGDFDRVWTLTTTAETGLGDVRQAMALLEAHATSPDDVVFVYFSTHGTLARPAGGTLSQYLVLSDTALDDIGGTALAHDELLAWVDGLPSRKKVALLATCHSGQGKSALAAPLARELASTKGAALPPLLEVSEATVVIGVCAWNETARESAELGHDIYTAFFLEALTEGDRNEDGGVTVMEAHDHARDRTWVYSQGQQRAYAQAEILGADPIVLAGQRTAGGRATLGTYSARFDGYEVRVDGVSKGVLPGQVTVDPGSHRVDVVVPGTDRAVASQAVRVDASDGPLDLGRLFHQDRVRVAGGAGWQAYGGRVPSAPVVAGEVHLPTLLRPGWEVLLHGEASVRWPHPVLSGGVAVERVLRPGPWQPRAGLQLDGYLLGAGGEPALLAPSLVPAPVVSLAWLPRFPVHARLAVTGGWLWYMDQGALHNDWTWRTTLVAGAAF